MLDAYLAMESIIKAATAAPPGPEAQQEAGRRLRRRDTEAWVNRLSLDLDEALEAVGHLVKVCLSRRTCSHAGGAHVEGCSDQACHVAAVATKACFEDWR